MAGIFLYIGVITFYPKLSNGINFACERAKI